MMLALLFFAASLEQAQNLVSQHQYQQANEEFRQLDKEHPNSAEIKTAWGNLFLSLEKTSDASDLFREAMKVDPNYAPAYLGLSRTLSEEFDPDSEKLAQQALEKDPKYFQAHEFISYLALEDDDRSRATEEAQKALAISAQAQEAKAVLASIDSLDGVEHSKWMESVAQSYSILGHFMEINYRYKEAIVAYRKAIDLDPGLAQARSRLGVNLMRTGQTDEAQKQLARCYYEHFQSVETRNSLKFLDTVNQYDHFADASTELVIRKDESALLRPYIEAEIKQAMKTYSEKYGVVPQGRIRVEVYPNHDDFVVRTIGLPGQGGLLGVTFGTVVAIDSPSARPPGDFSWADTLWHELCHVYVIAASHDLVPRWFSEGLAVHEEAVQSPLWGHRLTPEIAAVIKAKKLLPVLKLDGGFVRPQYPDQVIVSYYQAGKICDYISQRWGNRVILDMLRSYSNYKTTKQTIEDNLHESPETFDKDFADWLNKNMGDVQKDNGTDIKQLKLRAKLEEPDSALRSLEETHQTHPKDGETHQNLDAAIRTLEEVNDIYLEDQEVHQRLGELLLAASRPEEAVREYRAVIALKPSDVAASHFDLARALKAAHQTSEAKDEVLLALEAAPNYKPAQRLLLQLSQ